MTALPPHVESAAIVLDELQLVYVPIPKSGSTAMLWALLELADLDRDEFIGSRKLEVTRALTIHDTSIWGSRHRLEAYDGPALFESPDWITFTIVREPVRRIWSAWVSKILLRDPRFVAAYGEEDWFPEPPESAASVLRAFRSFVEVLSDRPAEWHDPHWSSQAELAGIGDVSYDVVARVEQLPGDLEPVTAHLRRRGRRAPELGRENPSLVAFVAEVLDGDSWERCVEITARDRDAFGYEPPPRAAGDPDDAWLAEVDARLGAIHAVIERNERIGDLKQPVTRSRAS